MNDTPSPRWKHLSRRPGSTYRQLFIQGTKCSAWQLYCDTLAGDNGPGQTPEEVARDYGVPLAAVQEAIAYCQSNPRELQQDFAYDDAIAEATGINDPNYRWNPRPKPLSAQERARIHREIYGA